MPEANPETPGGSPPTPPPPAPKPDLEIWRERATHAQTQVSQLTARITDLERELAAHKSRLADAEHDSIMSSSGALDTEVIRSLIDSVLKSKPTTDFKSALTDLKKSKPFLFRSSSPLMPAQPVVPQRSGGFTGQPVSPPPRGDRRSLLDYLRSKRA